MKSLTLPRLVTLITFIALFAMAVRTPVLVQAATEPLKQHCLAGRCGLWFTGAKDFGAALDLLLRDSRLRATLGGNGRAYVETNYSWTQVLRKYEILFRAL